MLLQTFCYWDKKQSADGNIIQFHLTLKCTKDQSSNFCDYFLVSKWIFHQHDRGLSKFHAGSEQLLVCVVINNCSYPAVKKNNTAYHAFGKIWMQARGFLIDRINYSWPKCIYCVCQPNELKREIKKKLGGQAEGQANIWEGHGPPRAPLRITTGPDQSHCNKSRLWSRLQTTLAQTTRISPNWI